MAVFLLAAAILLLMAVALVAYPLFRGRESAAEDQDREVVGLSRERLAALKQRKRSGEISESEYAEQFGDLEAQLADDLHAQGAAAQTPSRGGGRWPGIAAAVLIPVLSAGLYLALGQPQALVSDPRGPHSAAEDLAAQDIDAMVSRLADHLQENPQDAEGWFMLGRSYMAMNRYADAADAFARLRALAGDTPDVLVSEATARAMANGGALAGKPARLIEQALAEQPDHAQALWMAATHAYQSRQYDTAMKYYRRVQPLLDGEPRQQVDDMIQELAALGHAEPGEPDTAAGDTGASLRVRVALSPSMRADVDDDDTVFVFARAVDGPPMPLAVVRRTVADLPMTITLDDGQAMTPALRLSEFERVTVSARISRSGQPAAQPGDREGESPPLPTDRSETVEVVIDRVVPGNG